MRVRECARKKCRGDACLKASMRQGVPACFGCGWLVVGFVGKGCPASSNSPKEITESRLFTQRLKETAANMLLDRASACLYIFSLPVRPMTSVNFHFILKARESTSERKTTRRATRSKLQGVCLSAWATTGAARLQRVSTPTARRTSTTETTRTSIQRRAD